ncbi:MAG: cobaltochelatase CobT-related protein [Methylobacter sp.]
MSYQVETVRQSISIITKILSGKGIKVTQSGTKAFVESVKGVPERINIPYIPDNATDELMLAINGFLDHEVAHVLFTDFEVSQKEAFLDESVFQIYNAIEDCRIEKCMRARFAGSRTNLDGVSKFFIEKYVQPEFEKAKASGDEQEMISSLFCVAVRAWSEQEVFQTYMRDKWPFVKSLEDKIAAATPKIARVQSTQEAIDLAHEIHQLLSDGKDEPSKSESPDKDEKAGKDKKPKPKSQSGSKGKPGNSKSEKSKSEGEPEEPEPEEPESEEPEPEEPKDEEPKDEEPSEPEEPEDEESEDGDGESEESEDETEVTLDLNAAIGGAMPDMSASVAQVISQKLTDDFSNQGYRIFSTDFDRVEKLKVSQSQMENCKKSLVSIEEETRKVSGVLQKTLERLVKAKTNVRNLPGKRSGRVNATSLFRLKSGDDRVFKQKDAGVSNEVAVSLVVDCSGSMGGEKIDLAMKGAFALCDVLTRLNISNEVIGFTTGDSDDVIGEMRKQGHSINDYSRYEPLNMPIFKGFDERFGVEQKTRMALVSKGRFDLRNNVDGESIRIAARRLLSMTKERGKQMIVLSDGSPACYGSYGDVSRDLTKAVGEIEKMGIRIIGIGINDASVKRFYKNHIVINDINQLPELIIKELKALLV